MEKDVFISVGNPFSSHPIANLVKTSPKGESVIASAKKLRKEIADNPAQHGYYPDHKVVPSELYWAVFSSTSAEKPNFASDNYYVGMAWQKEDAEVQAVCGDDYIWKSAYEAFKAGYLDKKYGRTAMPNFPSGDDDLNSCYIAGYNKAGEIYHG